MPFDNSSHFVVNEATLTNTIVNNGISDIHFLYQHAARGASYNSKDKFDKPKCDPETRVKLLSDIQNWIKIPDKETGITLLHGPAGSGKSCIARSACEEAAQEGLLGASFFFWRSSPSRNNESQLVTTLAYQLAQGNKELGHYILSEVAQNPHVVELSLEDQFRKLIIEPCAKLPRERLSARVIVIDGLDECMGEETQICILQMLARAVRYEGFPLGFFITSRPELHLQEALDSKEVIFATKVISLNRIPGVSQDIRTVLESGFIRILNNPRFKRAMKSAPRPWPTPENIDQLVRRSSGQFIYAATVLKYVSDPDSNPASQLDIVLGIKEYEGSSSDSPFANLDRLYHQIMSRVKHPELTMTVLSFVVAIKDLLRREIITGNGSRKLTFAPDITLAVLHNQNRLLLVIEQLLEIPEGAAYSSLNQLHSLVSLRVGSESTHRHLEIDFYHKSFEDYVFAKERSMTFYVNLKKAHYELAQSCLRFMGLPRYETESQHVGWLYACFQWAIHTKFGGRSAGLLNHDAALKRFTSRLTDYLNITNLSGAIQVLGLSGSLWTVLLNNIQKFGLFPSESLIHALNDVRYSMGHVSHRTVESTELKTFNKLYTYPVWRKVLLSYNVDARRTSKLFMLFRCLTTGKWSVQSEVLETETCDVFTVLGLISDKLEQSSVLSRYNHIIQQLESLPMDGWWELEKLMMVAEPHEAFHCASEDISDVYTAIISTGVWRNHIKWICYCWQDNEEFTVSRSLLSHLKSEALEFHDNLELNRKLDWCTERDLFEWLRKKVRGPTEDIIEAWERAFDRARSLFPDEFKYFNGETVPRR